MSVPVLQIISHFESVLESRACLTGELLGRLGQEVDQD